MENKPKIKFGLKNAHYAPRIENGDTITYGTPKPFPGAVAVTLSPAGDNVEFYADNNLYYGEDVNNGYDGSMEMALISREFREDVLGERIDSNGVLVEDANVVPKPFALLFDVTTNEGDIKKVFYNCTAKRPNQDIQTKGQTKEVKTETLDLRIRPGADGKVGMTTTELTSSTVVNNWYNSVYEEHVSI